MALSFLVAALNVRYRDTQHVVEVVLLAGFWLNPIVYSVSLVRSALEPHGLFWAYFLNPMAGVVTAMQRALYAQNPPLPGGGTVLADSGYAFYLEKLGLGALVSALLLVLGRVGLPPAVRRLRGGAVGGGHGDGVVISARGVSKSFRGSARATSLKERVLKLGHGTAERFYALRDVDPRHRRRPHGRADRAERVGQVDAC